jgi:hypothetical protein
MQGLYIRVHLVPPYDKHGYPVIKFQVPFPFCVNRKEKVESLSRSSECQHYHVLQWVVNRGSVLPR